MDPWTDNAFMLQLHRCAAAKKVFKVATLCSGTDCMVWAMNALRDAMKIEYGVGFEWEHTMSVEIGRASV